MIKRGLTKSSDDQAGLFPQGSLAKEDKAPTLLFKAASETMLTIAAGPKHLGAKVGITAVLHTWGSAMTHHPHVYMIVTGGGSPPTDHAGLPHDLTISCPSKFSRHCSGGHAAGQLQFFGDYQHLADTQSFSAYLGPLWTTDWFVYAKRPFAGPEQVRLQGALSASDQGRPRIRVPARLPNPRLHRTLLPTGSLRVVNT